MFFVGCIEYNRYKIFRRITFNELTLNWLKSEVLLRYYIQRIDYKEWKLLIRIFKLIWEGRREKVKFSFLFIPIVKRRFGMW